MGFLASEPRIRLLAFGTHRCVALAGRLLSVVILTQRSKLLQAVIVTISDVVALFRWLCAALEVVTHIGTAIAVHAEPLESDLLPVRGEMFSPV